MTPHRGRPPRKKKARVRVLEARILRLLTTARTPLTLDEIAAGVGHDSRPLLEWYLPLMAERVLIQRLGMHCYASLTWQPLTAVPGGQLPRKRCLP